MVTCPLCQGWGKRFEHVVEVTLTTECTNCDGTGKVAYAGGWRPFENSKETVKDGRDHNRCNLHNDCAAADATFAAQYPKGKDVRYSFFPQMRATHCSSEDCEDCFGC